MKDYYLRTMTVAIPLEDGPVVIRQGKTVEYQLERTYESEDKSTRVKRRVIGKVDPVNPGRMFPNETYFLLFPENEVLEEVRDEFLRECAIKRQMSVIRKNPEEIIEGVVTGLQFLRGNGIHEEEGNGVNSTMLRRLFDDVYYSVEELAGKYPNEVMDPYKAKRVNEVLEGLQKSVEDEAILAVSAVDRRTGGNRRRREDHPEGPDLQRYPADAEMVQGAAEVINTLRF